MLSVDEYVEGREQRMLTAFAECHQLPVVPKRCRVSEVSEAVVREVQKGAIYLVMHGNRLKGMLVPYDPTRHQGIKRSFWMSNVRKIIHEPRPREDFNVVLEGTNQIAAVLLRLSVGGVSTLKYDREERRIRRRLRPQLEARAKEVARIAQETREKLQAVQEMTLTEVLEAKRLWLEQKAPASTGGEVKDESKKAL